VTATSIIVGAGVAGRTLHAPALAAVRPDRQTIFVDPGAVEDADVVPTLKDVARRGLLGPPSVVHICTPVGTHVSVLAQAMELGAEQFIVEKPLASDRAQLAALRSLLASRPDVDVVPVAVWPHAISVDAVRDAIEAAPRETANSIALEMHQHKDRREDARRGRGGSASVFDVEVPHMILLARHLLGPVKRSSVDVRWDALQTVVACTIRLHHHDATSTLHSSLDAPERRRSLHVRTSSDDVRVDLPTSRHAPSATVYHTGLASHTVDERPLDAFLRAAYDRFDQRTTTQAGRRIVLPVDLAEHLDAVRIGLDIHEYAENRRSHASTNHEGR
jgi:predicted dehydrogenase